MMVGGTDELRLFVSCQNFNLWFWPAGEVDGLCGEEWEEPMSLSATFPFLYRVESKDSKIQLKKCIITKKKQNITSLYVYIK